MLLIDGGVPKNDTHIVALRLSERKNEGITEVTPHIFRLNICEDHIRVHSHADSKSKTLPGNRTNNSSLRWHTKTSQVVTKRGVKLNDSFGSLRTVKKTSSNCQ